jgi:hypothetical protein
MRQGRNNEASVMRISAELYADLRRAVAPHMPLDGMNSERKRWDALWASGFDVSRLYHAELNDNHINTALKKIATFREAVQ